MDHCNADNIPLNNGIASCSPELGFLMISSPEFDAISMLNMNSDVYPIMPDTKPILPAQQTLPVQFRVVRPVQHTQEMLHRQTPAPHFQVVQPEQPAHETLQTRPGLQRCSSDSMTWLDPFIKDLGKSPTPSGVHNERENEPKFIIMSCAKDRGKPYLICEKNYRLTTSKCSFIPITLNHARPGMKIHVSMRYSDDDFDKDPVVCEKCPHLIKGCNGLNHKSNCGFCIKSRENEYDYVEVDGHQVAVIKSTTFSDLNFQVASRCLNSCETHSQHGKDRKLVLLATTEDGTVACQSTWNLRVCASVKRDHSIMESKASGGAGGASSGSPATFKKSWDRPVKRPKKEEVEDEVVNEAVILIDADNEAELPSTNKIGLAHRNSDNDSSIVQQQKALMPKQYQAPVFRQQALMLQQQTPMLQQQTPMLQQQAQMLQQQAPIFQQQAPIFQQQAPMPQKPLLLQQHDVKPCLRATTDVSIVDNNQELVNVDQFYGDNFAESGEAAGVRMMQEPRGPPRSMMVTMKDCHDQKFVIDIVNRFGGNISYVVPHHHRSQLPMA